MLGECLHAITNTHGLAVSLFLAGLVGGFTHCSGMCAPFVLAQTGAGLTLRKTGSFLLLPYHLGRMTTYVALSVLVSGFVNLAFLFSDLKSLIAIPLLVTAGVIFLVSAFPRMAVLFPWVGNIQIVRPIRYMEKSVSVLIKSQHPFLRYALGILLGFMPCGLVVAALMASATAPTLMQSALAMAAFTLGTIPALILVAMGGGILKQKFPNFTKRFSQGAMAISGLWLFALAGTMIF